MPPRVLYAALCVLLLAAPAATSARPRRSRPKAPPAAATSVESVTPEEPSPPPEAVEPPAARPVPPPPPPTLLNPTPVTDQAPALAPLTPPEGNRPLPPPAPLPELAAPSSDGSEALEESFRKYETQTTMETASKRVQALSDVPMSVAFIPASELEGAGQFTLCDVIQYFPGLECRRGAMRKAVVSARGLGSNFLSNRLLLLQDGRPDTDPWTGQFYPDETTPLVNVKQIEVIRGAGSSLYGSNAFAGVINIIHRDPEDLIRKDQWIGADLRLLGGQYNTYRPQVTVAAKGGPVSGLVNYYGYLTQGPSLLATGTSEPDRNQWARVQQVSGRFKWDGGLTLDASYTESALGRPGGNHISTVGNCGSCHYTPRDTERVQYFTAQARYDVKATEWLRIFATGYANLKRRVVSLENQITTAMEDALGKRRRLGGELRLLFSAGNFNVTVGGDVKNDVVNNANILATLQPSDINGTIVGVMADGEYRPIPTLAIGAGVRYDHYFLPDIVWRTPSSQISPRASIVYHPIPLLSLRVNYGRAFRAPTFAELSMNQQMYASTLVGNPFLKAETLDTAEASIDLWPLKDTLRLSGTVFYKKAYNFINEERIGNSISQFQNIGDAQVKGFEIQAAAKVPRINTSVDVAYQYLDARSFSYGALPGGTLDYAPGHRVYFRGHTTFGPAFLDLYALYVSGRVDPGVPGGVVNSVGIDNRIRLPAYLVANARLGVNVVQGLSFSVLGQNIFNTQYEETHGFPNPGASVFGEIKYVY